MRFLPQEIIRTKRDGAELTAEAIGAFVRGLVDGDVTDAQAAALAMAIVFRGLSLPECVALTGAMTHSGEVLRWDLPGPALDKHSTGGVGDLVSLVLAPAVAACGGFVPMISGRGLGHTGGTLDKLESIPGYAAQPDLAAFRRTVREVGCAIIGQTVDLAPADRRLYAIRDTTGTVESVDLITASILSKKLAAGLDGLVMDVKVGSGAFMTSQDDARRLADRIVAVGSGAGLATTALLTDMDSPLATTAGNALEVATAIGILTGRDTEPRLRAVTLALGAEMLVFGSLARNTAEGSIKIGDALASGAAAERFGRMVAALGGPGDLVERPSHYLAGAPVRREVPAPQAGYVAATDARAVGLAVIGLGGGRTRPQDGIDHAVGFAALAAPSDPVGPDAPLAIVHARDEAAAEAAIAALQAAYRIGHEARAARPAIIERRGLDAGVDGGP